jgi:hypothetical protein
MIEWENGDIAADDLVTCAIYSHENDLLDKPGWKHLKHVACSQMRRKDQAKMRSYNTAPMV